MGRVSSSRPFLLSFFSFSPLQRRENKLTNRCLSTGYTSDAAAELRDSLLRNRRDTLVSVHSRVLGNVIYFMASLTARQGDLNAVSEAVGVRLGGWKERERVGEEEGGIDGEGTGEEDGVEWEE